VAPPARLGGGHQHRLEEVPPAGRAAGHQPDGARRVERLHGRLERRVVDAGGADGPGEVGRPAE
jgi:hypothetical protein